MSLWKTYNTLHETSTQDSGFSSWGSTLQPENLIPNAMKSVQQITPCAAERALEILSMIYLVFSREWLQLLQKLEVQ